MNKYRVLFLAILFVYVTDWVLYKPMRLSKSKMEISTTACSTYVKKIPLYSYVEFESCDALTASNLI